MTTTVEIPTIVTDRLRLRAPRQSDFDAYAAFRAGERSVFIGGPSTSREAYLRLGLETALWLFRGYGSLIIALRSDDQPIGLAGFYHHADWDGPEIGWALFDGQEGHGYASEAARALLTYAFEDLGWTHVECSASEENTRSVAMIQRLGAERIPSASDMARFQFQQGLAA